VCSYSGVIPLKHKFEAAQEMHKTLPVPPAITLLVLMPLFKFFDTFYAPPGIHHYIGQTRNTGGMFEHTS
jgi:hypothetical protein